MPSPTGASAATSSSEDVLAAVWEHLLRLRLGSIAITVHDDRVVQLDVTEKRRLAR